MGNVFFFPWEISLMEWLQSFESGFLNAFATFVTMLGEEYLMILILGICYWSTNKDLGRKVSLAFIGGSVMGSLLKGAFLRRRPYMDNPTVKCIRAADPSKDIYSPAMQGYSFPSLHATMSAATYGTIARNTAKKIWKIAAVVLPFLIGLSRPYLGVHYPTDVLVGWALGIFATFVLGAAEKKWGYKAVYIGMFVVASFGLFYCRDNEFFSLYGIVIGMLLGLAFEEKAVNFAMPEKWYSWVLRPVFGVVVFAVVSALLKMPVQSVSAQEHAMFLFIYRTCRYVVTVFIIIGLYPLSFKKVKFLK